MPWTTQSDRGRTCANPMRVQTRQVRARQNSSDLETIIAQWRVEKARESYEQTARVLDKATREQWPSAVIESLKEVVRDHDAALAHYQGELTQLLSKHTQSHARTDAA